MIVLELLTREQRRRDRRAYILARADKAAEKGTAFSCQRALAQVRDFPSVEHFFAALEYWTRRADHHHSRAMRLYHATDRGPRNKATTAERSPGTLAGRV